MALGCWGPISALFVCSFCVFICLLAVLGATKCMLALGRSLQIDVAHVAAPACFAFTIGACLIGVFKLV